MRQGESHVGTCSQCLPEASGKGRGLRANKTRFFHADSLAPMLEVHGFFEFETVRRHLGVGSVPSTFFFGSVNG